MFDLIIRLLPFALGITFVFATVVGIIKGIKECISQYKNIREKK